MSVEVLAGIAGGATQSGGSLLGNLVMNQIENAQYEEHQKDNFRYSQLAQLRAATNTRTSMMNAGISPAMMANGQFSPAQMAQAPMQNKSVNVDPMAGAVAGQQLELLASEARLKKAEAADREIEVQRKVDEDKTYNQAMRDQFKALADRLEAEGSKNAAEVYRQQAEHGGLYNKGNYEAWTRAVQMINTFTDSAARDYDSQFRAAVSRKQLKNDNIIEAQSLLPGAAYDKIMQEIGDLSASQALKAATVAEKSANTSKITAEIDEVVAHIAQLLADENLKRVEAGKTYHSDFAAMIKDGNYGQAAASLVSGALTAFVGGAGFSLGSKVKAPAGGVGLRQANRPQIIKESDKAAKKSPSVTLDKKGRPQTADKVLKDGKWVDKPKPKPKAQKKKSTAFPLDDTFARI